MDPTTPIIEIVVEVQGLINECAIWKRVAGEQMSIHSIATMHNVEIELMLEDAYDRLKIKVLKELQDGQQAKNPDGDTDGERDIHASGGEAS